MPLVNYQQAIWRLVARWEAVGRARDADLDFAIKVVADIYWYSDEKVWSDVRKFAARNAPVARPLHRCLRG